MEIGRALVLRRYISSSSWPVATSKLLMNGTIRNPKDVFIPYSLESPTNGVLVDVYSMPRRRPSVGVCSMGICSQATRFASSRKNVFISLIICMYFVRTYVPSLITITITCGIRFHVQSLVTSSRPGSWPSPFSCACSRGTRDTRCPATSPSPIYRSRWES